MTPGMAPSMSASANRLMGVVLDPAFSKSASAEVAQDRVLAIHDLLEGNVFLLSNGKLGPYNLRISAVDQRLVLEFKNEAGLHLHSFNLSLGPMRRVMKDYAQIRDGHALALKASNTQSIEAIDMARRALHNEGTTQLQERLKGKAEMDFNTARRLFTLVCALTPRNG